MGLRRGGPAAPGLEPGGPQALSGLRHAALVRPVLGRGRFHRHACHLHRGVQSVRRAALISGLAVLALVWIGPLLTAWRESVLAHMTAHMAVVAVAAPLIAIGLGTDRRSTLLLTWWEKVSPRAAAEGASSPFLTSLPVIASLVELIIVWGWHAPAARAFAETSVPGTVLEQGSFLFAGVLLWHACLNGGDEEGGAAAGAFGLLLTSVHMTLLGALLALSERPLYGAGEVTCFGLTLTAGQDQQLGGVVMLLIGAAVYLAGGVALLARLLRLAPVRPGDSAAPRGGGAPG
ncbi:MAG: cytochrome c oxidase assembly protein [Rhizobiaceae bacterium]|nr:cytochrome c oxidase assembly protein [Rhizobiaceae bacterium]MCV0404834.1 cytochrome c oxidase assembly protein [Rhizobiaceae bacterium]